MEESQFVCTACDKEYQKDTTDVMTECRVCHRIHCSDCVDEFGRCIECQKPEPVKE